MRGFRHEEPPHEWEVIANWNFRVHGLKLPLFKVKKDFIQGHNKSLSVGCGAYEPFYIGATNACDICSKAKEYLDELGWKGEFKTCPCDELDYEDKEFDVAVSGEVIEHLPTIDVVLKSLRELDRVANNWLATTPLNKISGIRDKWNTHEGHKQFFAESDIPQLTEEFNAKAEIIRLGEWAWIVIKKEQRQNET